MLTPSHRSLVVATVIAHSPLTQRGAGWTRYTKIRYQAEAKIDEALEEQRGGGKWGAPSARERRRLERTKLAGASGAAAHNPSNPAVGVPHPPSKTGAQSARAPTKGKAGRPGLAEPKNLPASARPNLERSALQSRCVVFRTCPSPTHFLIQRLRSATGQQGPSELYLCDHRREGGERDTLSGGVGSGSDAYAEAPGDLGESDAQAAREGDKRPEELGGEQNSL